MYKEKFDLTGRTALVTGGNQGIGFACAEALAEAGAEVILAARNQDTLASAKKELTDKGYAIETAILDVTDTASVDAVAKDVEDRFGGLDILVCNSGIARSGTSAESVTDEHFADVMNVNLTGVFRCCRAFGKGMLERGRGAIVNIGSISAHIVNRPQNQSYYNASKAAVHQLTKSLAAEWADRGVRVNCIAPGYVVTPMTAYGIEEDPETASIWYDLTPTGRFGSPDEIGSIAHFLASDASSLMTGSVVIADGGYTLW